MTVVFTIAANDLIVMASDSVETKQFANGVEYGEATKWFSFPRVGCVTTWGTRVGNKIGSFLKQEKQVSADNYTIDTLAELVFEYLIEEYQPHKENLDDIGYHVAGFDPAGNARLYHIFWGFDRPKPPHQLFQGYKKQDHSPPDGGLHLLYNGRNDLAETVVRTLLAQINSEQRVKFNLGELADRIQFSDLVLRFATELTPEVGMPFEINLISPQNRVIGISRKEMSPISKEEVLTNLGKLFS